MRRLERDGFTIVELMIVIVVIAILAAISIVAYTNVQNRTHDAVVQQDLRQIGTKLNEWIIIGDGIPRLDHTLGGDIHDEHDVHDPIWDDLSVSRDSYDVSRSWENTGTPHNLLICRQRDGRNFGIIAYSRSGNGFAYTEGAVQAFEHEPAPIDQLCPLVGVPAGSGPTGRAGSGWLFGGWSSGEWLL